MTQGLFCLIMLLVAAGSVHMVWNGAQTCGAREKTALYYGFLVGALFGFILALTIAVCALEHGADGWCEHAERGCR